MNWINPDVMKPENGEKVLTYWPPCSYHDGCMQSLKFTTDEEGDAWTDADGEVMDEPALWTRDVTPPAWPPLRT